MPAADVSLLVPALVQGSMSAEVIYKGPLDRPGCRPEPVAELVIKVPGLPDHRIGLVTEADVAKGGFVKRLTTAAATLYDRYLGAEPAAS